MSERGIIEMIFNRLLGVKDNDKDAGGVGGGC